MLRGIKFLLDYVLSVLKVSCLLLTALFVPRLFVHYMGTAHVPHKGGRATPEFRLGLENIRCDAAFKQMTTNTSAKKPLIGLVTNHTGKDQRGNRNIDILKASGLDITTIFTPKHGYFANIPNHQTTEESDPTTGIPLIGWHTSTKRTDERVRSLDILIFDLQDSGMRHGYVTTLLDCMKVTALRQKKIIVLDRPNLLGSTMEGCPVDTDNNSVTLPVPIRHGMTVGELAQFFNKHLLDHPANLHVVPMQHYSRHIVPNLLVTGHLSPNLPNTSACYGYTVLGLLGEIAPFDIGIGTDQAFQCLMLPESTHVAKQTWYELQIELKKCNVETKFYRTFNDRKKQFFSGLKFHVSDITTFSSVSTLLVVLNFFKKSGVKLTFSNRFDSALGTEKIRKFLQENTNTAKMENEINRALVSFFTKASHSFIYKPLPNMVHL
jgi:uncharacterized protein YbbC (DUF1343 family)